MATQTQIPGTEITLLDRVNLLIKQLQEDRQELEEAFTKAQNRYDAKTSALDYQLETLRRTKEMIENA